MPVTLLRTLYICIFTTSSLLHKGFNEMLYHAIRREELRMWALAGTSRQLTLGAHSWLCSRLSNPPEILKPLYSCVVATIHGLNFVLHSVSRCIDSQFKTLDLSHQICRVLLEWHRNPAIGPPNSSGPGHPE